MIKKIKDKDRGKSMKRMGVPILSTALLISMACSSGVYAADGTLDTSAAYGVQYKTHIQDIGWEGYWVTNGDLSGTIGQGKRLESLRVELVGGVPVTANIQTYVHVQNKGNLGPFVMGNMAGTEGQGLRLESIRLVLNNLPGYTLRYNVQVQNEGWLKDINDDATWFISGETAGTAGKGLRLEGIRIKLVAVDENMQAYYSALAAVNEYDYTKASWADYQDIVNENIVDSENTVDEIKTATRNIKAAQGNLVKGKIMSGYITALQAVNEAEYTPSSWSDYMMVVEDNVVDQDNTQAEINMATLNIMDAQKQLQFKVNLTDYEKVLASVREEDYTEPSWSVYQNVLTANVMTEANSQIEVNTAVNRIKLAQNKMVRKFDFSAYNALLNAVKEDDYIESSWSVYQLIVDDNQVDEDDTQTDIETAIKNIEAAQARLVKKADLKYYQAALDAVNKNDYTTASWTEYQKAINTIIVNVTSNQDVVKAAVENILENQKKLVPAADMTYYEMALEAVGRDDYTSASWLAYQKVVDANVVIPTDGQEAVNQAILNIEAAQKKLVKGANLDTYKEVLAAVNSDGYTSASWDKYQKVISRNVMTGDKTQAQVDAATEKIRIAQAALIERGSLDLPGGYNETIASKSEIDYTSTSWATYDKVLNSNYMDADKSQAQIDTAVRNIKRGQLGLKKAGDLTEYLYLVENNKNLGIPMVQGQYTSATWNVYQKILDKNEMNRDKTQTQINSAVVAIERAQKNLKLKGDMTEYNATLALVKEADYTVASWSAYLKVVMSKDNYMNGDNDESAIKVAIGNIKLAQTTVLKKKGNVDDYNRLIAKYVGQQDKFTTKGWNAYMAVLAKYVMTTENTQDQIQSAITFITLAQEELLNNPSAYLGEYTRVLGLVDDESSYTPESWTAYMVVVNKYRSITKDSLQSDVDKATAAILKAQSDTLVRQNGTELKAFQKVLELYQNNYRSGSGNFYEINKRISNWEIYEQAVLRYASFYEDYTWKPSAITTLSKPEEITAATNAIDIAIRALRPKTELGLDGAIASYEAVKAAAIPWNNAAIAMEYTEDSFEAYATICRANDLQNLIIDSTGTLMTPTLINNAAANIQGAMDYKKPVLRAKDGDVQKFQFEKNWYTEFKKDYYTKARWTAYESKITTTYYDLDHPENIEQTKIQADTNTITALREALIYNASYIMEQARITATNLGSFSVSGTQNNVIERTKALMSGISGLENFNIANYSVTYMQITGDGKGTATINPDGSIASIGDGKATVKISIQALNDTVSTEIVTTGELTLTIIP
ncbi:hypothetical protein [Acetobacterium sp. KB-1]|jgi:hypothetical protein|uniref:hypothetical protein n=1 Tax=Acetobacterium sp. KB-1 TaxID=2184575 RepID=UPI0013A6FA85|nr:hypothetical protein [Acetobacterium sp. KB-1]